MDVGIEVAMCESCGGYCPQYLPEGICKFDLSRKARLEYEWKTGDYSDSTLNDVDSYIENQ